LLFWISVVAGLLSAGAWIRAATVKVSVERAQKLRKKTTAIGKKTGIGLVALNGNDVTATLQAQAVWNSIAGSLAALALLLQAIERIVGAQ
tara:strand:- start:41 stop:313 length:273 start_codon:yes stop_codon:yes gene_type:complete